MSKWTMSNSTLTLTLHHRSHNKINQITGLRIKEETRGEKKGKGQVDRINNSTSKEICRDINQEEAHQVLQPQVQSKVDKITKAEGKT